jgi:hypothetical protein
MPPCRAVHQLIAAPMGLFTAGVTYFLLSGAVALLALPLLGWVVPTGSSTEIDLPLAGTGGGRVLFAGLGLVLLLGTPAVLRSLAAVDVAVARALLGPVPGALAQRVHELERSRARVVDA